MAKSKEIGVEVVVHGVLPSVLLQCSSSAASSALVVTPPFLLAYGDHDIDDV